jgi:1,4-dihydroxy-2-naphthoyl-CoA synthase
MPTLQQLQQSFEDTKIELKDGIAFVYLARPQARNAFTYKMSFELEQAFEWISTSDEVKVVLYLFAICSDIEGDCDRRREGFLFRIGS